MTTIQELLFWFLMVLVTLVSVISLSFFLSWCIIIADRLAECAGRVYMTMKKTVVKGVGNEGYTGRLRCADRTGACCQADAVKPEDNM